MWIISLKILIWEYGLKSIFCMFNNKMDRDMMMGIHKN